MKWYTLKVQISSDSGVGPYTDTKYICNCVHSKGIWYHDSDKGPLKSVEEKFNTSMIDYQCIVMEFTEQPTRFIVN